MNTSERFYLRPAARVDAGALFELRTAIFAQDFPDVDFNKEKEYREIVQILTDQGASTIWLADLNGEVVGYVRSDALGAGHERLLAVTWLGVRGDVRRRGYGTKLLNAASGDIPAYAFMPCQTGDDAAGAQFFSARDFSRIDFTEDAQAVAQTLGLALTDTGSTGRQTFIR
ncbi:GNAT family N-acetyltransferase [Arcanobacterium phocisimile]|uniref:GNAT family N-acetyltransferase n=1 Tax=Arcanobacterium phocisimile TaxID=1302235 RepID=A0ABX7IGT5_9ACTO|nr:GNAT family N-acetyltransferase [Arcanobacterium phocisimile]QRV02343.1 GNAT family N-acetyltransferase [Arcanobacterium phocisimile]